MAFKSLVGSEAIARYVNEVLVKETEVQKRLRAETALLPNARMQISADQGAFLSVLVHAAGAKQALEIGTFTGYSALCIAGALKPGGKLIACDVSEEWTSIARRYWKEAGLADRIDLRLAPAIETLAKLEEELGKGSFDFAFIDADKDMYDAYYEATLRLLRPGGMIAMDNMLGGGGSDPAAGRMHTLNMKIRDDERVEAMLATIGPGTMLVWKK